MGRAARKQVVAPQEPVTKTVPDLDKRQKELLDFKGEGFDLRSRIVDPKTGKIIRHQPYRMVISQDGGDYFIRDAKRYSLSGVEIADPGKSTQK